MKRKEFLKISALGGIGSIFVNGHAMSSISKQFLYENFNCEGFEDRIIVLVQLKGGNDGLNTIIPINQFDKYVNLRPDIFIPNRGNNKLIELDSTLSNNDQVGIHPAMTGFKELYDEGSLNIIQAVSYPKHNRSHFKSTDLLLTGGDGNPENFNIDTGWIYRFLDSKYSHHNSEDPLGIQLGSNKPSVGFHSSEEHAIDLNLSGQDPAGYFSLISSIGNVGISKTPQSDYGDNLRRIMEVEDDIVEYGERISTVFNKGRNEVSYPETKFSDQLKTVARLISGGSKTKFFLVSLNGFDTHNEQIVAGRKHLGKHAELLSDLSEGILSFQKDLEKLGLDDLVVTATFSEFGRKARQNGNYGTDHGNTAPLFVIGKNVKSGVTGTNVDLSRVDTNGQLNEYQHDYRQVFSTLIQDWMGGNDVVLKETYSESYKKLDLIDKPYFECNIKSSRTNRVTPFVTPDIREKLKVYPVPTQGETTLFCEDLIKQVVIYDITGNVVYRQEVHEVDRMSMNLSKFQPGIYTVKILTSKNESISKKITKL